MLRDLLCFSVIAYLLLVIILTSLVFGPYSESVIVLCMWCYCIVRFIDEVDGRLDG